jgi:hypothetical protein
MDILKLILSVLLLSAIPGGMIALGVFGAVTEMFWGLPFFLMGILLAATQTLWGPSVLRITGLLD